MKNLLFILFFFFSTSVTATKHDIQIKDFKFSPNEITIVVGDNIRWTNKEKRQYHSVWFEALGDPEPDYFFPDEFFERTFNDIGDFPYRCGPHPKMMGIVHVKKAIDTSKDVTPEKTVTTKQTEKVSKTASLISLSRRKEIMDILIQDCGSCHGMTLQGGLGPSLLPAALERMTQEQVALSIAEGRPGTPMPPWKPFFNKQELQWLAKQLKQGIEKTENKREK